jgi:hypothetical protein
MGGSRVNAFSEIAKLLTDLPLWAVIASAAVIAGPPWVFRVVRQYWDTRAHAARRRLDIEKAKQQLEQVQNNTTVEVSQESEPTHAARDRNDRGDRLAALRQVFQMTSGIGMPQALFFVLLRPICHNF